MQILHEPIEMQGFEGFRWNLRRWVVTLTPQVSEVVGWSSCLVRSTLDGATWIVVGDRGWFGGRIAFIEQWSRQAVPLSGFVISTDTTGIESDVPFKETRGCTPTLRFLQLLRTTHRLTHRNTRTLYTQTHKHTYANRHTQTDTHKQTHTNRHAHVCVIIWFRPRFLVQLFLPSFLYFPFVLLFIASCSPVPFRTCTGPPSRPAYRPFRCSRFDTVPHVTIGRTAKETL